MRLISYSIYFFQNMYFTEVVKVPNSIVITDTATADSYIRKTLYPNTQVSIFDVKIHSCDVKIDYPKV